MTEVGYAYVSILPSAKNFGRKLNSELSGGAEQAGRQAGKRAGEGLHSGLANPLRKVTGLLAGAFVVDKAVGFFKDAVAGASDLNESASKVSVVFGKNDVVVRKFARNAAKAMGITEQATLEATGTFGNLFVALKLPQRESAKMSTTLVKLAGDLASFNNVDPAEALDALRSGLVGETEPMRRFGVNMNDATLRTQALKLGLIDTVKDALTPAAKAQAAYALILEQTTTAQGDFTRTSGGLANQQRIMAAQWGDLKTKIGTQLLPVMVQLAHFTNNEIIPAVSKFVDGMQDGTGAGGQFADVVGDLGDQAKAAWSHAKPIFSFIGAHPKLFAEVAKDAVILAAAMKGISTVKKLPGLGSLLGGGKGGLLGQVATVAKPLPVFVTNPGFGLGAGKTPLPTGGGPLATTAGKLAIVASTVTVAGGVVVSAKIGHDLGVAAAAELNKSADRNLSANQKAMRDLVESTIRTFAQRTGQTPGPDVLGAAAAALKPDKILQALRGARGKDVVNLVAAYDFLKKYGAKTAEVQAAVRALAKDPVVAAALRQRALDVQHNVDLITGGLSKTAVFANASARSVATSLDVGMSGGLGRAREKTNALQDAMERSRLTAHTASSAFGHELGGGLGRASEKAAALREGILRIPNAHPKATLDSQKAQARAESLYGWLQRLNGTRVSPHVDVLIRGITASGALAGVHREGFASGTLNAPPGWAWTGENGPELIRFRGGEQVFNQQQIASFSGLPNAGSKSGLTVEHLEVVSAPHERAEVSVPRALETLAWEMGLAG